MTEFTNLMEWRGGAYGLKRGSNSNSKTAWSDCSKQNTARKRKQAPDHGTVKGRGKEGAATAVLRPKDHSGTNAAKHSDKDAGKIVAFGDLGFSVINFELISLGRRSTPQLKFENYFAPRR